MKAEVLLLRFTGTKEREDDRVYFVCREAPVVGCGKTDEEASQDLTNALRVYVEQLEDRGELDKAIELGLLPYIRVDTTSGLDIKMGKAAFEPIPETGMGWLLPAGMAQFGRGLHLAGV